jgi:hypothetical protein
MAIAQKRKAVLHDRKGLPGSGEVFRAMNNEADKHIQFIANELLTFSVITRDMSREEQQIAAEGNAEHILQWVTSTPVKRRWWQRLFQGRAL